MLLPYVSDYLYLQNTERVWFPCLQLIHFFHYWIVVDALCNADFIPRFPCLCLYFSGRSFEIKWEGLSVLCIRVVHFLADYLAWEFYRVLSCCFYSSSPNGSGWNSLSPTFGHPWWRNLPTIWHDSTSYVFVFGPDHRGGTWFDKIESIKEYW
jgi:hypothetical protein